MKKCVPLLFGSVIREDAFGDRPYLTFYVGECIPDDLAGDSQKGSGKIVGFAAVNPMHNIFFGRSAYLNGLFVQEEHRGMHYKQTCKQGCGVTPPPPPSGSSLLLFLNSLPCQSVMYEDTHTLFWEIDLTFFFFPFLLCRSPPPLPPQPTVKHFP